MSGIRKIAQACAVPYRFGQRGLEFCLITARKSGRWGFPKGTIQRSETAGETAINEALEEGGLVGRIVGQPIGSFEYSKRQRRMTVTVMLMAVDQTNDEWLESGQRSRQWVTVHEARIMLDRTALLDVLQSAVMQLKRHSGEAPDQSAVGA